MYVVHYTQRNLKINRDIKIKVFLAFPANCERQKSRDQCLAARFAV